MSKRSLWLPSLSRIALHLACPGSVVLPRGKDTPSPDMDAGTAVHLYLEHAVRDGDSAATSALAVYCATRPHLNLTDLHSLCLSVDFSEILAGREVLGVEQAFAYRPDADTARILGDSIGRQYRQYGWEPEHEIPGTADLVLRDGERVVVVDYKTASYYDGLHKPSWEAQVCSLALAAARAYHCDEAEAAVCVIQEGEPLRWQRHSLDVWDLAAWADRLAAAVGEWRRAHEAAEAGTAPLLRGGAHCTYCPSYAYCPRTLGLAAELRSAPVLPTTPLQPWNVGDACARYADSRDVHKAQGRQLDEARDILWGHLHNHGGQARSKDGRLFRATEDKRGTRQLREQKGGSGD